MAKKYNEKSDTISMHNDIALVMLDLAENLRQRMVWHMKPHGYAI